MQTRAKGGFIIKLCYPWLLQLRETTSLHFLSSYLNGRDANIVSTFDQCAPVTMVAGVKRRQKIKRAAVLIQFQNYFQGNDN